MFQTKGECNAESYLFLFFLLVELNSFRIKDNSTAYPVQFQDALGMYIFEHGADVPYSYFLITTGKSILNFSHATAILIFFPFSFSIKYCNRSV